MKTPTYTQTHTPPTKPPLTKIQARTKNKYNKTHHKKEKDNKNPHRAGRATQARPNFKGTPQQHNTNNQVKNRIQTSIIQNAYQNSSHQDLNVALYQHRNTYAKHNITAYLDSCFAGSSLT